MILSIGDIMYDYYRETKTSVIGGSAINVALWLKKLGSCVTVMGRVGNDEEGRKVLAYLKENGIDSCVQIDSNAITGKVVYNAKVDKSDQPICTRGANAFFRFDKDTEKLIDSSDWIHISGYTFLENDARETALKIISVAKKHDKGVSIDPASSAYILSAGAKNMLKMYKGADILLPNYEEGSVLTGEIDSKTIIEKLAGEFEKVILKMDSRGCLGKSREKNMIKVDPVKIVAKNHVGLGDAFNAAYIHYHLLGHSDEYCMVMANRLGAIAASSADAVADFDMDEMVL